MLGSRRIVFSYTSPASLLRFFLLALTWRYDVPRMRL